MPINNDLPLGFGMALMKNPQAFEAFSHMSYAQQQSIIDGTHSIYSKQEMRAYVASIAGQD
ncbi:MAG: hypothetical protein ACI4DP_03355 [Candidatus Ornithomonoglobus sp.]